MSGVTLSPHTPFKCRIMLSSETGSIQTGQRDTGEGEREREGQGEGGRERERGRDGERERERERAQGPEEVVRGEGNTGCESGAVVDVVV